MRLSTLPFAISSVILATGSIAHARAFKGAAGALAASGLSHFYVGDMKVLWLADSANLMGLALVFALVAARPFAVSRATLVVLALMVLTTSILIYVFLGGFYAAHLLLAAAALALAGVVTSSAASAVVPIAAVPAVGVGLKREIAVARTIAEFPLNTFLESLAFRPDGALLVSSHPDGIVYEVGGDQRRVFAKIEGTIAGLALEPDGNLLVSGWIDGKRPAVFRVDRRGISLVLVELAGAVFPNGFCHLRSSSYLLADSYRGAIWEVDAKAATARVWLQHPLLARPDASNPLPGVNGLKMFRGALYASNTQAQRLIRIPVRGTAPGEPEVFVEGIGLDDFAFDEKGNLYGATHVQDGVVRIDQAGNVTIIAAREQGVAGSTAVAFGTGKDETAIFVSTNGGMSNPPPGGVEPGRIVRIDVGVHGASLRR